MVTCWKNPPYSSTAPSEPDEFFASSTAIAQGSMVITQNIGAIAQGNEAPIRLGSATLGSSDPKPTFTPESALAIMYSETDLQQLLKICMGTKKAP